MWLWAYLVIQELCYTTAKPIKMSRRCLRFLQKSWKDLCPIVSWNTSCFKTVDIPVSPVCSVIWIHWISARYQGVLSRNRNGQWNRKQPLLVSPLCHHFSGSSHPIFLGVLLDNSMSVCTIFLLAFCLADLKRSLCNLFFKCQFVLRWQLNQFSPARNSKCKHIKQVFCSSWTEPDQLLLKPTKRIFLTCDRAGLIYQKYLFITQQASSNNAN